MRLDDVLDEDERGKNERGEDELGEDKGEEIESHGEETWGKESKEATGVLAAPPQFREGAETQAVPTLASDSSLLSRTVPQTGAVPVAPPSVSPSTSTPRLSSVAKVEEMWAQLPTVNRAFALSGALCLLLPIVCLLVPAIAGATTDAIHPYTAAGRAENCLANLGALHRALGLYATDNEGFYPALDYTRPAAKGKAEERVTWVSLVRDNAGSEHLQCPSGPGIGGGQGLVSSYALNPVLSLARTADVDNPAETLLLADGGPRHDLSLLPPYPSWPSFAQKIAPLSSDDGAGTLTNLALRHSGSAGAVYADGHAALLAGGDWEKEAAAWGGSAVLRRSLARLSTQNAWSKQLITHLKAKEIGPAAELLRAHRKDVGPLRDGLTALWQMSDGESASASVTEMGWNLARASALAGDTSFEKQFNTEESRRSQAELTRTKSGGWKTVTTSWGLSIDMPAAWTLEEETEGRYKRAYLRSAMKSDVYVLIETGEHSRYITPRPIDWGGMESDLRKKYGRDGYKRIALDSGLLDGQTAGVWEYEITKVGSPRLRKRCIGYSDGTNSHVVAWTAPARDFNTWQSLLERVK